MIRTIGMRVEDLACYGLSSGETLTSAERADVIDYARAFEECSHTREELAAMPDEDLIGVAYAAMAEYAMGQI